MICEDGKAEDFKRSALKTLDWESTGMCLAIIRQIEDLGLYVGRWQQITDRPEKIESLIQIYSKEHPEVVYGGIKNVLRRFPVEFCDWQWGVISTDKGATSQRTNDGVPEDQEYYIDFSVTSNHTTWTQSDPPRGGHEFDTRRGWFYAPHRKY